MTPANQAAAWLGRVRHDLVKRLLWPARDRRDLGGAPAPGELRPAFIDAEGRDVTWDRLWQELRGQAPATLAAGLLDDFERSLASACAAAERDDLRGVLSLEAAWDALARFVEGMR